MQLASGMAGALIVRKADEATAMPFLKDVPERLFIFQQLAFDKDGEVKHFDDLTRNWKGEPGGGAKKHTTINGRVKPRIVLNKGQVERWRLIDAGIFDVLDVYLVDDAQKKLSFRQIAIDGITLKAVREVSEVELGPGYRTDLLVKAPAKAGLYQLVKRSKEFRLAATKPGGPDERADPQVLAVVEVVNAECTAGCGKLPDQGTALPIPPLFKDDLVAVGPTTRTVEFSFNENNSVGLVNGKPHSHGPIDKDFCLKLTDTEEWSVSGKPGSGNHPFHIHVNAFQVFEGNAGKEWRDTIIVRPNKPPQKLRMRYDNYDGKFVLHCHNLEHEDLGMMRSIEISSDGVCNKSP